MDDEYKVKSIGEMLPLFRVIPQKGKSERGALLEYFARKTGKKIPYIAFKLTGIQTPDLYHIKKQCDQYNGPWSKAFFGMLKVRK